MRMYKLIIVCLSIVVLLLFVSCQQNGGDMEVDFKDENAAEDLTVLIEEEQEHASTSQEIKTLTMQDPRSACTEKEGYITTRFEALYRC